MKRRELFGLRGRLTETAKTVRGLKTSYALARTLKAIEAEMRLMEDIQRPAAGFQEYDRERIELCRKHCAKDEKGNPKMLPGPGGRGEFDIIDRPAFEAEIAVLRSKHDAALPPCPARVDHGLCR